uniref:Putative 28S ribosomal S34, mitochondrial-like n=1 Tax=Solanum chacoense TaxID=4108 RepID=A0A0V0HDF0_SOLCH
MVNALVNRAATVNQSTNFFRASFSLLRNLSTATPTKDPSTESSADGPKKPKRKKKKNLFEVAQFLPNWGLGYHMAKTHWANVSYEITKINLYKDGRHGKAWGLAYRDGLPIADAPKKISGVHKRCWKYIANLKKPEGSFDQIKKTEESTPNSDVQAA